MSSNSVFINYRRSASSYLAQLVWRELTDAGIDAFYDINSIDAGQFDQIILNQIAARPYFMPILSPGTLERCKDPGDWVLREMQEALRLKRVIVPLVTEAFDFADFDKYLPPELATELKRWNAMPVPPRFFKYAIMEVRERFLKPIDIFIAPTPKSDAPVVAQKLAQAQAQPEVTATQLTAQEYFERALARPKDDVEAKIADYSEAIRLNPRYADAYNNRGIARQAKGDLDAAIADFTHAIQLNPHYAFAYNNRGAAHAAQGDLDGAIADYTQAIRLNPRYADVYYNRGNVRRDKDDLDDAIADYSEAIHLNPQFAFAYHNRGIVRQDKDDLDGAIADFSQAIQINPQLAQSYMSRGAICLIKLDLDGIITNYSEAIRINPQFALAYEGRGFAHELKREMKQAAADYRRVLELQPDHPNAETMCDFIKKHG